MDQQKKSSQQTPPFEPGKKPAGGGAIAGKHGMSYSRVRHLARMATKKQTKEDVEQVDELKKSTLASYAMKAADQARNKKDAAIGHVRKFKGLTSSGEIEKSTKADQRIAGVKSAIARLAKEDVNELSNELLQRYKKEAGKQVDNPATPSSMKYKRGLGHLMATVKQMKSGKPMPKESIQQEETNMDEMSKAQMKKREEVVKSMKKNFADFRKRYGEKAKSVMYATATKMAKEDLDADEEEINLEDMHYCAKHVYSEMFGEGVVVEGEHAEPDEEKDPGRILTEAAGAGALGALGGRVIGRAGARLQQARAAQEPVMEAYNQAALEYAKRASGAARAGARSTALASQQKVADIAQNMAAGEAAMKELTRSTRLRQGEFMAAIPGLAALGGMAGGGISNVAQYMGVPGFQQDVITDPEITASSNTPMARSYTPTLRYLS